MDVTKRQRYVPRRPKTLRSYRVTDQKQGKEGTDHLQEVASVSQCLCDSGTVGSRKDRLSSRRWAKRQARPTAVRALPSCSGRRFLRVTQRSLRLVTILNFLLATPQPKPNQTEMSESRERAREAKAGGHLGRAVSTGGMSAGSR